MRDYLVRALSDQHLLINGYLVEELLIPTLFKMVYDGQGGWIVFDHDLCRHGWHK